MNPCASKRAATAGKLAGLLGVVALLCLGGPARAQISVALSDNIVVLDSRTRSGLIELVNLGDEPTEFRLEVDESLAGTPADASSIVRWAPSRALVPAHQTRPLRIAARPTPELAPGEYVFRLGVTAEVRPVARRARPGEAEAPPDGIAVRIPIVPTLPVTVYLRHGIEPPMIDVEALVATPDDPAVMGYFPVRRRNPAHGFVGQVQVVERGTGRLINGGRLHLRPGGDGSRVSMPRAAAPLAAGASYCVRVWDHFPATGPATVETCGQ